MTVYRLYRRAKSAYDTYMKNILHAWALIVLAPAVPFVLLLAYSGYSSSVSKVETPKALYSEACKQATKAYEAAGGGSTYEQWTAKETACGGYASQSEN